MGKISEAIRRGRIESSKNNSCNKPIIIKTKDVIDANKWDDKKLKLDEKGYFLFEVEDGFIYAGFVNHNHEMEIILKGKNGIDLFKFILEKNLVSSKDNAAYIGYELGKAELCLKENKKYIQS